LCGGKYVGFNDIPPSIVSPTRELGPDSGVPGVHGAQVEQSVELDGLWCPQRVLRSCSMSEEIVEKSSRIQETVLSSGTSQDGRL
jgi:hypothetical protein